MMKKTTATLLTLPLACACANAAPEVYSNFDLEHDIGIFSPEFRWSDYCAPLDIRLPVADQLPYDFIGQIPENTFALNHYAAQASGDIGYKWFGGDNFFGSNVSFIEGPTVRAHWAAYPDDYSDFESPAQLTPGDTVGPGQVVVDQAYLSANPTVEFGGYDYWFVPQRFIMGVLIELDDGTHYGFAEFENINPLGTIERDYQPVRWGFETLPDTPFVIPADCGLADTNRDNTLDFFDVSVYLSAYADNRFAADLNQDGTINFFDVSIFLNTFNAGCP